MDTVSDVEYSDSDLNIFKQIRSQIRSKNIHTIFIPRLPTTEKKKLLEVMYLRGGSQATTIEATSSRALKRRDQPTLLCHGVLDHCILLRKTEYDLTRHKLISTKE